MLWQGWCHVYRLQLSVLRFQAWVGTACLFCTTQTLQMSRKKFLLSFLLKTHVLKLHQAILLCVCMDGVLDWGENVSLCWHSCVGRQSACCWELVSRSGTGHLCAFAQMNVFKLQMWGLPGGPAGILALFGPNNPALAFGWRCDMKSSGSDVSGVALFSWGVWTLQLLCFLPAWLEPRGDKEKCSCLALFKWLPYVVATLSAGPFGHYVVLPFPLEGQIAIAWTARIVAAAALVFLAEVVSEV